MSPLVSALLLNYRNGQQAVRSAKHLLSQTVANHMEIFIVDNGSEDDSVGFIRNALRSESRIRLIETGGNDGFGHGYNKGASYARGEYLFINNPDKMPGADVVELLMKKLESDPTIGIVAPRLLHPDGTQRISARAEPRPFDLIAKRTFLKKFFPGHVEHYLQQTRDQTEEHDVDWVAGGCFMIRREFFEELGGFDDRFFLFFEDTDLCHRVRQAGKRVVYFPTATVYDKKRRLSDMSAWKMPFSTIGRAHMMSGLRYFWKWRHSELGNRDSGIGL
jgi:N-acetylglucosaminyl-diphospho-decaprenol L-rhamnosyltransferase